MFLKCRGKLDITWGIWGNNATVWIGWIISRMIGRFHLRSRSTSRAWRRLLSRRKAVATLAHSHLQSANRRTSSLQTLTIVQLLSKTRQNCTTGYVLARRLARSRNRGALTSSSSSATKVSIIWSDCTSKLSVRCTLPREKLYRSMRSSSMSRCQQSWALAAMVTSLLMKASDRCRTCSEKNVSETWTWRNVTWMWNAAFLPPKPQESRRRCRKLKGSICKTQRIAFNAWSSETRSSWIRRWNTWTMSWSGRWVSTTVTRNQPNSEQ